MGYTFPFWGEDNPFTPERDENTALSAQPGSFGAIDIAALQHLYGARAHNAGNDVYRFSDDVDANRGYTTIWDTGGSDTIVYEGSSAAKIDLRAATLKAEIGGGGWLSTSETLTGGVTIANGVSIEKAKGGAGDDILIGNDGANPTRRRTGGRPHERWARKRHLCHGRPRHDRGGGPERYGSGAEFGQPPPRHESRNSEAPRLEGRSMASATPSPIRSPATAPATC